MAEAKRKTRKTRKAGVFGTVHQLPSGNLRALYFGPDGLRHKAPTTFQTEQDARAWLSLQQADIIREKWSSPTAAPAEVLTLREYAQTWLEHRTLKPRTREHYTQLLRSLILPTLGDVALTALTPTRVRTWHAGMNAKTPTMRAHAYSLLRTITRTAVSEDLIAASPCTVAGAGTSKRVHRVTPATLTEIGALVAAMPDRYKVMTLLAAWCGCRFGELAELRRKDVDAEAGVLRIRRGVVLVEGNTVVGTPKSAAGIRDVAVPPHLLPALREHLVEYGEPGRDGLLFPAVSGGHLSPTGLYSVFYPARVKAGRPDLRWHDLRHTGAVLAASTGASLAELMSRLGHSTPQAAMKYQHAALGRDAQIAAALSALVGGVL